ncbi:MAG TPA: tetratricopeptide repeat protein [Gammaproteobacteria bacterium]
MAYKDDYVWQEKFSQQLPKAEAGDVEAQYDIAIMYEKGNGVSKDMEKAFEWFGKAAKQGNDKAAFKVGYSFLRGEGVAQDYDKALTWLTTAAEHKNVRAYYYLGTIYEKGRGVQVDLDKALNWYSQAAKGGYIFAEERIAAVTNERKKEQQEVQVELEQQKRLERQKVALTSNPEPKPKEKTSLKDLLLEGGWSSQDKPAEYLPSRLTKCIDKGKTIECVSREITRSIGMADISYTTKAVVYGINDSGEFKVSYRNNVVDIKVTDPEFVESGGKVPVQMGWQDAEHKLDCSVENSGQLKCNKNNLRSMTFYRK